MKHKGPIRWYHLAHPRQWPLWCLLGFLRLTVPLPYPLQLRIGAVLGRIAMRLAGKRRRIAQFNLRHCFPEWSDAQVKAMTRRHFESLGIGMIESAICWWGSDRQHERLTVEIRGLGQLRKLAESGRGIILLSAHFTTLEISGRLLARHFRFAPVYRRLNNPLLEFFTARGRSKGTDGAIPKENLKAIVRHLKRGGAIWYASDQHYDRAGSALVPFMGRPAHTALALPQLARVGEAAVVPFFTRRTTQGYVLELDEPLQDFPGESPEADLLRYHVLIESHLKHCPEQYLWVHERFKGALG